MVGFGLILLLLVWGGLTLAPATAAWLWVRFWLPGGESGCAVCGYDLSGTPNAERCPECGIARVYAHAVLPERLPLWRFWIVPVAAIWPSLLLALAYAYSTGDPSDDAVILIAPVLAVAPSLWFLGRMNAARSSIIRRALSAFGFGALVGGGVALALIWIRLSDPGTSLTWSALCICGGSGWGLRIAASRIVRDAKLRRREAEARAVGSAHG